MTLFNLIVLYLKTLQQKGRLAADEAVKDQDPILVKAVRASFSDKGKLIKADGSAITLLDLMGSGIKSPL